MRRLLGLVIVVAAAMLLLAACGDDSGDSLVPPVVYSPTAVTTVTATIPSETTPVPTEFRVAFINLMSPVALDSTNSEASDTYDQRLAQVIDELKAFKPDLVGFNEATNTTAHGNAAATLAKELKMEPQQVRSNPWFPSATKEQNDEIAKQSGFEEFEVILTRSAFPILKADLTWLNPRTSETEGRAALHVVVKAPAPMANIDVYITHLTGGGDKVRSAQAASVMSFITSTRGTGPLVLMGDLSDVPSSATYKVFADAGLHDLGAEGDLPTCCRDKVVGQQAPLTQRTDYLFAERWVAPPVKLWGDTPRARADGSLLYDSDHDGLTAVFPLAPPGP
jgi:endonuclease/exonuclease/phosphatase family metal-dependent hydrolase